MVRGMRYALRPDLTKLKTRKTAEGRKTLLYPQGSIHIISVIKKGMVENIRKHILISFLALSIS
jgi:hypothetical protein